MASLSQQFVFTREILPQDARYRCWTVHQRTAGKTQTVTLELKHADRVIVLSHSSLFPSMPSPHKFNLDGQPNVAATRLSPDTATMCMNANSWAFLVLCIQCIWSTSPIYSSHRYVDVDFLKCLEKAQLEYPEVDICRRFPFNPSDPSTNLFQVCVCVYSLVVWLRCKSSCCFRFCGVDGFHCSIYYDHKSVFFNYATCFFLATSLPTLLSPPWPLSHR